jgi:signal transduction histidine kinase
MNIHTNGVKWDMASETHKTIPNRHRVRAWLRDARAAVPLPESPGTARRPGIFVLLFWSAVTAALLVWVFDLFGEGRRLGILPVSVATAILVAAWMLLPWDPRATMRRKLLGLSFFAFAVFVLCQTTNVLWSLPFYSIAVADGVFLFGFGNGALLAAATLPFAFVGGYLYLPPDVRFAGAVFLAVVMVPVAGFVVGICKTVIDAQQSRQEARALLRELEETNAELKRQAAKVRELAISEERARIAREVHDSVGHHLTAINLQLQNAERFERKDQERSRREVREARESALSALAEVRRSVRALKPPALEERSGVAALAALARSFDGAGPAVSFELEGEERELSEEAELVLYRATQEGLTNAAKHSRARRARVKLAFEPEPVLRRRRRRRRTGSGYRRSGSGWKPWAARCPPGIAPKGASVWRSRCRWDPFPARGTGSRGRRAGEGHRRREPAPRAPRARRAPGARGRG